MALLLAGWTDVSGTSSVNGQRLSQEGEARVLPADDTIRNSANVARRYRAGGSADWPEAVEGHVDSVLAEMTLEEKIGQMTQLEIGMVTSGDHPETIDPEKLETAVQEYHVGAILNVGAGAYSLEHWHETVGAIQEEAQDTRLQIPVIYGIDAVHGANYTKESVLFPQQLGMGATWNPHLMEEAAAITARDVRASGITWNFSPVLDVGREPVWPRLYETFSEDPYLSSVMGLAAVRGYEGTDPSAPDKVASTLKHYVGYSGPDTGMDRTPARLTESELREKFLLPFRDAVEAGALSIMVNSGEVNGTPAHASEYLLTDLLRTELGFEGLVVSDWRDIKKLVDFHHSAATEREATKQAVMAGVDMSMVPSDYSFYDHLLDLVRDGEVPESRIDEAVRRILSVKFALGMFEDPMAGTELADEVGSEADRQVSLQAARESITLLRNEEDLLPLSGNEEVLVTGPTAQSMKSLHNGWTYTWQGQDLAEDMFPDRPTIVEAIRNQAGDGQVQHVPGTTLDETRDVDAAVSAAQSSDVVVMALGEGAYAETPGNTGSLELPDAQQTLLERVSGETDTPIALMMVEGRPRVIGDSAYAPEAVAVAYNPGPEGGQALAEVLFGEVNPSGHLPVTYPRVPVGAVPYDHTYSVGEGQQAEVMQGQADAVGPLFDFGEGLSYTTFEYSDLSVGDTTWSTDAVAQEDSLSVSVTVSNTGDRAGKDVVQLYVSDHVASLTSAVKELRRFAKVDLAPGESQTLRFQLGREDLAFTDQEGRSVVEPGAFTVQVDTLEQRLRVTGERLSGDVAPALGSSQ
jgi:beta-glucosidase